MLGTPLWDYISIEFEELFSSYLFILFVGEEGGQPRVLGPGDGYQVGVFEITLYMPVIGQSPPFKHTSVILRIFFGGSL